MAAQPASAAGIEFADPRLKTCVNRQLGQDDSSDVTLEQALSLRTLNCDDSLASLSGLESFTNLIELSTFGFRLADLSPLSPITGLTKLTVRFSSISDLSPLKSLTRLSEIDLKEWLIKDVSPLGSMTSLTKVSLVRNQIVDLTPFKPLVDRGTSINAGFQEITLDPLAVKETQANPARDVSGNIPRTYVNSGQGQAKIAPDFSSWSWVKAAKNNVVTWTQLSAEGSTAPFYASGFFVQDALPISPKLQNDVATSDFRTPMIIDVLANDGLEDESPLDPGTLMLHGNAPVTSLVTDAGSFDVVDGKIRFVPNAYYLAGVKTVRYEVANADGLSSYADLKITFIDPATVVPPVTPVTPDEPSKPEQIQPAEKLTPANSVAPAGTDAKPSAQAELANTGATTGAPLALAGLLLLAGIAAVFCSRRRAA